MKTDDLRRPLTGGIVTAVYPIAGLLTTVRSHAAPADDEEEDVERDAGPTRAERREKLLEIIRNIIKTWTGLR